MNQRRWPGWEVMPSDDALERSVDGAGKVQGTDFGAVAAVLGVGMFLAVVLALHAVQTDYDPVNQLMSELALGPHGWAMFFAFAGIAVALAGIQFSIAKLGAAHALRGLLILAAVFFLAAGVFPLGEASMIHISAIAAAFVTAVLAMYLFPSLAGRAAVLAPKSLSWSLPQGWRSARLSATRWFQSASGSEWRRRFYSCGFWCWE